MQRGIVLLAHGSRDPLWPAPIEAVAQRIRRDAPSVHVACAYLEWTTPTLEEAAAELVRQGVRQLAVMPMFLGMGKHAREDLPQLIQALRARHPTVQVKELQAVGEQRAVIDLLADIALTQSEAA